MPRTGKGGAKQQRTDLMSEIPKQSVGTGEDREYGARKQDMDAQAAVPMMGPREQPRALPGDAGALTRPSEYPDQPITAGLPTGPGPGPEALMLADGPVQRRKQFRSRMYAEKLARITGSPELKRILDGGR